MYVMIVWPGLSGVERSGSPFISRISGILCALAFLVGVGWSCCLFFARYLFSSFPDHLHNYLQVYSSTVQELNDRRRQELDRRGHLKRNVWCCLISAVVSCNLVVFAQFGAVWYCLVLFDVV